MSKTFRSYPNSYEVIEHLQDELQAELDNLEKEKKESSKTSYSDRKCANANSTNKGTSRTNT